MALSDDRLSDIVRELATRPGHDKVKASIQELLVDGLGAERNAVNFEKRVPEAQGRIDAIVGRTAFEVKSDLARELGDAEEQLSRYLPEREKATKSRFVGIATDGLEWRAYEWRNDDLSELRGRVGRVAAHRRAGRVTARIGDNPALVPRARRRARAP